MAPIPCLSAAKPSVGWAERSEPHQNCYLLAAFGFNLS